MPPHRFGALAGPRPPRSPAAVGHFPPTSSFPSGHTAAAVARYGCLAVIVLRQLANRWAAWIITLLCCCVPVIVGTSRVQRGMHYPSDVVFGPLGGGAWLLVTVLVVPSVTQGRGARRAGRDRATSAPVTRYALAG